MASSSASVASIQKPSTSNSSCSQRKQEPQRKRSCDSICSSNTSCFLQKKKPIHPLAASVRFGAKPSSNGVKQRVLSAKLLKLRSVQSQLNDANFHLAELAKENRSLRTLQKRQDKALRNYEGVDAELPRLIKSYEEETRILTEKNKLLKRGLREISDQVKFKDDEISALRSQLRHLIALTKDKHLGEREKLKEELEKANEQVREYENKINMLNRRLALETKNSNYKLNNEISKTKQSQRELAHALSELHRLSNGHYDVVEQKQLTTRKRATKKQSVSCASFRAGSNPELLRGVLSSSESSTTDLKLHPIPTRNEETSEVPNGTLKSPADNVKARLSSGSTRNHLSTALLKLSLEDEKPKSKSLRINSGHRLDVLAENLQNTMHKVEQRDMKEDNLGDYCLEVVKTAKSLNSVVDRHAFDYETTTMETASLLEKLKETDYVDAKLRKNQLEDLNLPEKDVDIVNKIWFEEYNFQNSKIQGDGNDKKLKDPNEKKKLLATLRAIDNGELVESIDEDFTKKNKVMRELFGNGSQ